MIPINEHTLHVVVPEQSHNHRNNNFCQDEHVVHVIAQQAVDPRHACQPLGQGKRAPRVQQDTPSPNDNVFQRHMHLLAIFGMEYPPVIDGTVHHPSHYRAQKRGIQIKDIEQLEQQDGHQKVDETGKLGGKLGLEKHPHHTTPADKPVFPSQLANHLTAIKRMKP